MIQPVIPQDVVTWALIIVSIFLVSGITYVYTNRNTFLTAVFSFLTIILIAIIKLVGFVDIKLSSSFLGGYNENHVGYVVAESGWQILMHAWHIWLLPVLAVVLLAIAAIISVLFYMSADKTKTEILTPTSLTTPAPKVTTSADRLNTFMAIDAAKKSSQETQEKLAEALLKNSSYEIQISDLMLKVRELSRELEEATTSYHDEINILELELKAKTKENQYILDQLSERSRELKRAQEMFEKLMEMHKGGQPT